MTVTVYFWPPKGEAIGHASIMADGGQPAGKAYLSAWPGDLLSVFLVGDAAYHEFLDDVASEGNRQPHSVALTKLNETAIKAKMADLKKRNHYSFPGANCATQASICLNAGLPSNPALDALTLGLSTLNPASYFLRTDVINTPWTLYVYAKVLATKYA